MARKHRDHALKARQIFGKYRILRRISSGGFATVYAALDRIEGARVAIKIPHDHLMTEEALDDFKREARITAQLDHPSILPLKSADFIGDRFVIVYRLGERSLSDRLHYRLSGEKALTYIEQMLEGMAYAHAKRIVHCDLKPDNMILFPDDRLCLTDFGIARVMQRTMMSASGSGTVGYIAPEQAMGRPSFRSDVFSLGLVMYRLFARQLPKWPYDWPPVGYSDLRRKIHPDMIAFIQKSIEVDHRYRYADARSMLRRYHEIEPTVRRHMRRRRR